MRGKELYGENTQQHLYLEPTDRLDHFSENAAETFEDKIFHLIQNEGLESESKCAILNVPQMSRQSERSQV